MGAGKKKKARQNEFLKKKKTFWCTRIQNPNLSTHVYRDHQVNEFHLLAASTLENLGTATKQLAWSPAFAYLVILFTFELTFISS